MNLWQRGEGYIIEMVKIPSLLGYFYKIIQTGTCFFCRHELSATSLRQFGPRIDFMLFHPLEYEIIGSDFFV